jgi:hypothetical protein
LLERAREWALALLRDDPELGAAEHALLREAIADRFGSPEVEPIAA